MLSGGFLPRTSSRALVVDSTHRLYLRPIGHELV